MRVHTSSNPTSICSLRHPVLIPRGGVLCVIKHVSKDLVDELVIFAKRLSITLFHARRTAREHSVAACKMLNIDWPHLRNLKITSWELIGKIASPILLRAAKCSSMAHFIF